MSLGSLWSILEDGRVRNKGFVLVTRDNREARKDVEMIKVAVALDQDDAVGRWKSLSKHGSGVHTTVAASEDNHILGCRSGRCLVCLIVVVVMVVLMMMMIMMLEANGLGHIGQDGVGRDRGKSQSVRARGSTCKGGGEEGDDWECTCEPVEPS